MDVSRGVAQIMVFEGTRVYETITTAMERSSRQVVKEKRESMGGKKGLVA